jgi:hypothetical protein
MFHDVGIRIRIKIIGFCYLSCGDESAGQNPERLSVLDDGLLCERGLDRSK